MLKNKLIFSLAILFLFSCKTSISVIETCKSNEVNKIIPLGIVYNLPQTMVYVKLEVNKIIKTEGPYSEFTEKYLGSLNDVVDQTNTSWSISKINIFSSPITDSSNTFIVYNTKGISYLPIKLSRGGFLISYNSNGIEYNEANDDYFGNNLNSNTKENFSFSVVSSDKNYKIVYDTLYSEQIKDSVVHKIATLKPNIVQKSNEEQAKELADKINILRDDRAALLVGEGDNDNLPDGDALKLMLLEIDKLEASYLSMFVGKIDTIKYTYTFSYLPSKNDINKNIVLFKFTKNSGVLPFDNIYGTPVSMQIFSDNYTNSINLFNAQQEKLIKENNKELNSGLFYRVPQKTKIIIKQKDQIIGQDDIYINQLGTVESLPKDLFGNEKLKIEFYPELGSIKSIFY